MCLFSRSLIIQSLAECINLAAATHVFATPSLWALLNASPEMVPTLICVTLGGEPISQHTIDTWSNCVVLLNMWGVTECTVGQTTMKCYPGCLPRLVGKPFDGVVIKIDFEEQWTKGHDEYVGVQSGSDANLECSQIGEILIGGVQTGVGYLNQSASTRDRFVSDSGVFDYEEKKCYIDDDVDKVVSDYHSLASTGSSCVWFRSGDFGRWNEGNLEVL